MSRLDGMKKKWKMEEAGRKADDYTPEMPPIEAGEYLISYLFDVGPAVSTGMGNVPVRSEHLIPWQEETGISLKLWEAQFLRRLSVEYVNESQHATERDCKPPWVAPDDSPGPTAA